MMAKERIENKLDMILDALGLSGNTRRTPEQRKELVDKIYNIISKFEAEKRG